MGASVRLLRDDEVELFRRIRLEALAREPAAFASALADWQALDLDAWRARMAAGPVVVAFDGDELVGLMGLVRERGSRLAHRATLVMVYVRPEARRSGLSAAMLACLDEAARAAGIRQVELHVSVENPAAVGFYRRSGFREIGRLPAAFLHEGREIDEFLMVRAVPPTPAGQ